MFVEPIGHELYEVLEVGYGDDSGGQEAQVSQTDVVVYLALEFLEFGNELGFPYF